MLELTVGNWVPIARELFEYNLGYGLAAVGYVCIVNVAIMRIVTGAFIHETSTVLCSDITFQVAQSRKKVEQYMKEVRGIFRDFDLSEDGTVNLEEFVRAL